MFHGYPALIQEFQKQMDAELIRIPFFSQTSDEAFINMTPSLNIAFNKDLEKNPEKLDIALDILDCMISEEGQKRIADGSGVISLNTDVPVSYTHLTSIFYFFLNIFFIICKLKAKFSTNRQRFFLFFNQTNSSKNNNTFYI